MLRGVAFTDRNADGLVASSRLFTDTAPLFGARPSVNARWHRLVRVTPRDAALRHVHRPLTGGLEGTVTFASVCVDDFEGGSMSARSDEAGLSRRTVLTR